MNKTIDEWVTLFKQINADCTDRGESVVHLSDVEYYAEQVMNIAEVPYEEALDIAQQIAMRAYQ